MARASFVWPGADGRTTAPATSQGLTIDDAFTETSRAVVEITDDGTPSGR